MVKSGKGITQCNLASHPMVRFFYYYYYCHFLNLWVTKHFSTGSGDAKIAIVNLLPSALPFSLRVLSTFQQTHEHPWGIAPYSPFAGHRNSFQGHKVVLPTIATASPEVCAAAEMANSEPAAGTRLRTSPAGITQPSRAWGKVHAPIPSQKAAGCRRRKWKPPEPPQLHPPDS